MRGRGKTHISTRGPVFLSSHIIHTTQMHDFLCTHTAPWHSCISCIRHTCFRSTSSVTAEESKPGYQRFLLEIVLFSCLVPDKADGRPQGGEREPAEGVRAAGGLAPGGVYIYSLYSRVHCRNIVCAGCMKHYCM
jgi:hypothetical protein